MNLAELPDSLLLTEFANNSADLHYDLHNPAHRAKNAELTTEILRRMSN